MPNSGFYTNIQIDIHNTKLGILGYKWPLKVILIGMTFERPESNSHAKFGLLDPKNIQINIHNAKLGILGYIWPLKVILIGLTFERSESNSHAKFGFLDPKNIQIDIHNAKLGILGYIWPSKVILKVLKVTRMTFERAYGHFRAVFGFLDHKNLPIDIHDAKLRVFRCTWPLKVILKVPKVKGWPLIGEDVLVTRAFDFWSRKCA